MKKKGNILCRWFGHSWKLKDRCRNSHYQSMMCQRCGRVVLVKGRMTKEDFK